MIGQPRIGVDEILAVNLEDDVLAWDLGPDGSWTKVPRGAGVDAHLTFQASARSRSRPGES